MKQFLKKSMLFLFAALSGCNSQDPSISIFQTTTASRSQVNQPVQHSAAEYENIVQQIYIAYFGRPADRAGMNFYSEALANANAPVTLSDFSFAYLSNPTVRTIVDGFGLSAESSSLYSGDNNIFVEAIYANLFNRNADFGGKTFWVNAINSGAATRGNVALSIMGGAQGTDTTIISNKTSVSMNFTDAFVTSGEMKGYSGLVANAIARTMLGKVGSNSDAKFFSEIVVISKAELTGCEVGVDYHAYGDDIIHTAFLTIYDQPEVRALVKSQLQGMADRGAKKISTRIWLAAAPGVALDGWTSISTFPLTDREQNNLHIYAQDVAAIQGAKGNRLRLDLCFLFNGIGDYTTGSPVAGLGTSKNIPADEFTSRLKASTQKVLAAIKDVMRADGVMVVDRFYLNGEINVARTNEDWFLTTQYIPFINLVRAAGFTPSLYFIVNDTQEHILQDDYIDSLYPALNHHRSMFWTYRTFKFMVDHNLPIPDRFDFSYYIVSAGMNGMPTDGATYLKILQRVLDDADIIVPLFNVRQPYGIAETYYFKDDVQRHTFGQAFALDQKENGRLKFVTFWTSPDSGGPGVTAGYPFALEDYFPIP